MSDTVKRPELLTILCILTFVGSGSSFVANGFLYLMFDQVKEIIGQQEELSFLGSEINLSFLLEIKPVFFFIQAALYFLSVMGAYQMFKLRKVGFHLYAVSQILLLIIPKVFIPVLPFPFFELVVSTVFIFLYYKNLKFMS
jgi:hypothetical protein